MYVGNELVFQLKSHLLIGVFIRYVLLSHTIRVAKISICRARVANEHSSHLLKVRVAKMLSEPRQVYELTRRFIR